MLNDSKVFVCDFGKDELKKPNPSTKDIGCDVNCNPGESFDVCTLESAEGQVTVGAMICADREFPEAATQLMLNGAELVIVPNACTWDEIRTAGLKTRAFESLLGIAMTNYPGLNRGNSQAHSCVAWRAGQSVDTLIAKAGEQEQILLATFDMDDIRAFRETEIWRMDYRKSMASGTVVHNSETAPLTGTRFLLLGNSGTRNSGTDGTYSDICLTRLVWLTMIGDFTERETSRLPPSVATSDGTRSPNVLSHGEGSR